MTNAGTMRGKLLIQRRGLDANNDRLGAWGDIYSCAAEIIGLKGSDPVVAARLQGEQPFAIAIYASSETRPIDTSYRLVDMRSPDPNNPIIYDIKSAVERPTRDFVDILAVWKVGQPNG